MAEDKKKDEKKPEKKPAETPQPPDDGTNPYSRMSNALAGGVVKGAEYLGRGMASELGFRQPPEQGGPPSSMIQGGPIPSRETAADIAAARGGVPAPTPPPKDPKTGDRGALDNATARQAGEKAKGEMGNTPSSSVDINNASGKTSLYGEEKGTTGRVSAAVIPGRGTVLGQTERLAPEVRGTEGARWTTKPMGRGDENNPVYAGVRREAARAFPTAMGSPGRPPETARGGFVMGAAENQGGRPFSEQLRTMPRPSIDMSKKGGIIEQKMSSMGGPFTHATSTTYELSGPEQAAARQEWIDRRVAEEQGLERGRAEQETQLAKLDYERRMAQMDPGYLAKIQAQSRYGGEYLKLAGEERLRQELSMIIAPLLEKHAKTTDPQAQRAIMEQIRAILSAYGRTPPSLSNPGLFFGSAESVGGAPAAGGQS